MASSEPRKTDQCQASYSNQQTDTEFFPRKTRCAPKHNIHHIHLSLFAFDHLHARPTTILSCFHRCFFKLSLWLTLCCPVCSAHYLVSRSLHDPSGWAGFKLLRLDNCVVLVLDVCSTAVAMPQCHTACDLSSKVGMSVFDPWQLYLLLLLLSLVLCCFTLTL
jgi:hypothetical protein